MDWNLIFAGGTFGIALASAVSAFLWLIIRLIFAQLKGDIQEIKATLEKIIPTIKSEAELEAMMDLKIARCREQCFRKIKEVEKNGRG